MKRRKPLFIVLCAVSGTFMLMSFLAIVITASIRHSDLESYELFNEPRNYEEITCRVDRIERDYYKNLNLTVEPVNDKFFFKTFYLSDENLNIAKENGVLDVLEENIYVSIWVIRNEYDTDWYRPIAGLSCNGTEYLSLDVGYKNIAQSYHRSFEDNTYVIIGFAVVLFIALSVFVANFIIYFTGKKPTENDTTATITATATAQPTEGAATATEQQAEVDATAADQPVDDK